MIGSVYIKDWNIHFYNENRKFTDIGGIAYILGKPLLDFVCYEPERFDDAFSIYASMFDDSLAYQAINDPVMVNDIKDSLSNCQQREVYVYFYMRMFMEFVYTFTESPEKAVLQLAEQLPGAVEKLRWTIDFEWPVSSSPFVQVQYMDKEKRLFRAATDVVELMSEDVRNNQDFIINEIELLLNFREVIEETPKTSLEYLWWMEEYRRENTGYYFYLENPFRSFYGALPSSGIVELYEINTIVDLFRYEFIKMVEHDIFIKKCKNCERFFIPRGRADAEYCDRTFSDTSRKCSEIGAILRYERKIAGNPILEAHKKAYRRFNSRTRAKKMT